MWIEASQPLRLRFKDGDDLHLRPGCPVEVPDDAGNRVLAKGGGKIRIVDRPQSDVVIEPAMKPDGSALSPIHFKDLHGKIFGPAHVEFVAKTINEQFWVVVNYEGSLRWILSDRLRANPRGDRQRADG